MFTRKGIDISRYPTIEAHLRPFYEQLRPRNNGEDTGRKPGPYEWYEIQDNVAYYRDFEKPKIIYPNMTSVLPFVYDKGAFYINDKCYIITGEKLPFLTCFFNSKLFRYCFKDNFPELPGVTRELRKVFFDEIPVKKPNAKESEWFDKALEQVQLAKKRGLSTEQIVETIEERLCRFYGLSAKEELDVLSNGNQSVEANTTALSSGVSL